MARRNLFTTLVVTVAVYVPTAVSAALVTNPARPIAYRVNIQLIQTALDDGTSPATVLGDPDQCADIESKIDAIWAQAGIDINFFPNVIRYNNTFANQGNGGARPATDLDLILSSASQAGILNPDPTVIDMFFVNTVPGWPTEGSNWVNGESNVGADGIAEHMGNSVPTSANGREYAAHWIAHEIGHNLGLYHSGTTAQNLMNGSTRTTEQLTSDQIDAVLQQNYRFDDVAFIPQGGTSFPKLISEPVPGDFNRDGYVNAADYTVWRDTLGSGTFLAADANNSGAVDSDDYSIWQSHFSAHVQAPDIPGDFNRNGRVDAADFTVWRDSLGSTVGFGTGADANMNGLIDSGDYALWQTNYGTPIAIGSGASSGEVPEPANLLLAMIGAAPFIARRFGTHR